MPRIRIDGCAQGSGVAWLVMPRFASMAARMAAALGTWWVPRSNQLLHAMQHRLALDALLQNQWLRTWQQHCFARMPRFESLAAHVAAACRLAHGA
jgi:hypothetical protein